MEFQGCKLRKRRGTASTEPRPRAAPSPRHRHRRHQTQPGIHAERRGQRHGDGETELTEPRDLTPEGQTDPEQRRDVTSVSCVPDARETHAQVCASILSGEPSTGSGAGQPWGAAPDPAPRGVQSTHRVTMAPNHKLGPPGNERPDVLERVRGETAHQDGSLGTSSSGRQQGQRRGGEPFVLIEPLWLGGPQNGSNWEEALFSTCPL